MSGKQVPLSKAKLIPDHALFVGFTEQQPGVCICDPYCQQLYSSTYAAEISNDVMEYYYQVTPQEELITGTASEIAASTTGD